MTSLLPITEGCAANSYCSMTGVIFPIGMTELLSGQELIAGGTSSVAKSSRP